MVSGSDKGREFLLQLLKEEDCQPVTPAASGDEARAAHHAMRLRSHPNQRPCGGEKGPSLAVFAVENTTAAVLLLVKAEVADETAAQVEREGVLVLAKPLAGRCFPKLSGWDWPPGGGCWAYGMKTSSYRKKSRKSGWWTGPNVC